jgi:hypothetical protein
MVDPDPDRVVVLLGRVLARLGEDRQDHRAQHEPARTVRRLDGLEALVPDQLQQGQVPRPGVR